MQRSETQQIASELARSWSLRAQFAVVLGSGFAGILPSLDVKSEIRYSEIPGFPQPAVEGHSGKIVFGTIAKLPIIALSGRCHFYEGFTMDQVTLPIRVLAELGVRDLLLTNAAGGINKKYRPGDFMRLTDHINFMGAKPIRGGRQRDVTQFVDLSHVYDPHLGRLLDRAARQSKVRLHRGVYLAVSGPSYETPAEIRAFGRLGADAVGMSTVPEAIVARQCGLRVAGLSCITNWAAGLSAKPLSHAEVLATGRKVQKAATDLLRQFALLYAKRQ